VAFVCDEFNRSSVVAQPWRHIYEIAKRMIAQGNEAIVITTNDFHSPKDEEIDGIPVHRVESRRIWCALDYVLEEITGSDVDLVNWHGGLASLVFPLHLQRKMQKKIVWSVHMGRVARRDLKNLKVSDIPLMGQFWYFSLYSLCPNWLLRKGAAANQVRKIIALSERLKNCMSGIGIPRERMVVIPSGIDLTRFDPSTVTGIDDLRRETCLSRDSHVLLYFGSPSPLRGLDCLLKALPRIERLVPSTRLIVLSRQPTQYRDDPAIERVRGVTVLQGIQSPELIARFLAIADVVVLPFRFWPYTECPLTILESMAMRKPLVTSWVGSIPEVVKNGQNGLLVDPRSPKSIANTVVTVLRDRTLCERLGKNAREYVMEHHSWDDVFRRTLSVFEQCIGSEK